MAKKKSQKQPDDSPDTPKADPSKWGKQPVLFQVRGNPEFKKALLELAEFEGIKNLSDLIDRAVRAYAREIKYPKTLPKR